MAILASKDFMEIRMGGGGGWCLKLEILSGGGVWQLWKSGRKEGSKKRAFRRGGVDFFWNSPFTNRQSKKYRQVKFKSNEKRLETLFTPHRVFVI